ncbi:MAG TPA: response regulator transcription factor [Candidatus Dormibacteraeota bacterium]|nr:response regulator transcription factor [Candidatus Dormibacteraeota bacterium]
MREHGPGSPKIRILVVDDQTLFREGLVELLKAERDLDVVGQAEDGEEAVRRVAALLPDVVLMDVHMPRLDGIRATARIVAAHPKVRVLMLASLQTDGSVVEALQAGACGYVLKDTGRAGVVEAIMQAAEGRHVLSHDGQRAVVTAALGRAEEVHPPAGLSARQFQILRLMSRGLELKQIGRELGMAEKTVRNQASLMYAKLRVHDRAQAILYALHKGLAA